MDFDEKQMERYSRNMIMPDMGIEGQRKISTSRVLVIGTGGLGSPALLYLAAAGVGTLGMVDCDVVELSNLQRQVIHFTNDIDKAKVESAKEKITQLNPDVSVNTYLEIADSTNILEIIKNYDFIIDGTDNFSAKFLINDACVMTGKPFSHAGVLQLDGQTLTVIPGTSACFRCLFPEPPPPGSTPTCAQAGILGTVAGIFGLLQATEALKYIVGTGDLLTNRLMIFNAAEMKFMDVKVNKNANCPVCGKNPTIVKLIDYE